MNNKAKFAIAGAIAGAVAGAAAAVILGSHFSSSALDAFENLGLAANEAIAAYAGSLVVSVGIAAGIGAAVSAIWDACKERENKSQTQL